MSTGINCPHCHSPSLKKNGHTHYGKQNYLCKSCTRQFVENGQAWFISDSEKELIDKLLLERIPLAGICRVTGVSERWLLSYIKERYAGLPDDLNAEQQLPDEQQYLAARLDEEIERIRNIKKNLLSLRTTPK